MTKHEQNKIDKVYIVAVSGGVDSVVLLHMLVNQEVGNKNHKPGDKKLGLALYQMPFAKCRFVVAHFDHGIRKDSNKDCLFVKQLAKGYDLPFECARGKLGPDASEAKARKARYRFLHQAQNEYQAKAIITAHHQDDMIETAIINFIRGTGRKGLSSLRDNNKIIRPLLNYSKSELLKYALKYKLNWRDDPSNLDTKYLRNYVRQIIIPTLNNQNSQWREQFIERIEKGRELNRQIDSIIDRITEHHLEVSKHQISISRGWLIMLPNNIGKEVIIYAIKRVDSQTEFDRKLIDKALMFVKTAKLGKMMPINKQVGLYVKKSQIVIKSSYALT